MNGGERLPARTMFLYSISEAGLLLISYTLSTQLSFFMTDILGITAAAAGTMFLVSRIWDAVNDPLMGILVEKTNTRLGRYRPYLLIGGIPLVISLFLNLTEVHFGDGNLIYMYVVYIFFGMSYTAAFIPYTTMMGNLAPNPDDRAKISSIKAVFQSVGVLVASVCTVPLLHYFGGGQITAGGFQKIGFLYGGVSLVLFLITFFTVKERPIPQQKKMKYGLKTVLSLVLGNRNLMMLVIMYFLIYMRMFLNNSAAMYYFRYSRQDMSIMPIFMAILAGVKIVSSLFIPKLTRLMGKRRLTIWSMVACVASYFLLYLSRSAGTGVFLSMTFLVGLTSSVPYTLVWALVADVADETAEKQGFRADGILYSVTSFANKFAGAISGFVCGAVLSATGYVANQPQTAAALGGIDLVMFIIPGLCMALVLVPMLLYQKK